MKKEQLQVPISPWCRECPSFQKFTKEAEKYGLTTNDIAVLAIRSCQKPPKPHPELHNDGTPLEYWETTLPLCEPGWVQLELDAQLGAKRLGFELS